MFAKTKRFCLLALAAAALALIGAVPSSAQTQNIRISTPSWFEPHPVGTGLLDSFSGTGTISVNGNTSGAPYDWGIDFYWEMQVQYTAHKWTWSGTDWIDGGNVELPLTSFIDIGHNTYDLGTPTGGHPIDFDLTYTTTGLSGDVFAYFRSNFPQKVDYPPYQFYVGYTYVKSEWKYTADPRMYYIASGVKYYTVYALCTGPFDATDWTGFW